MDPAPFEPHMPEAVRAAIAEARAGRGPAAPWLAAHDLHLWEQTGLAFDIVRGRPPLPDELGGWLVGISTFADERNDLARVLEREPRPAIAPAILSAFAAGLRAGVPTQPRQWKGIERIARLAPAIPEALREVIPLGLVADQATTRAAALELAHAHGARAAIARAATTAAGAARTRLEAALGALAPAARAAPRHDLLSRLLAAYAATFDTALAAPIARAGAEAAHARPPLRASSKVELEAAWGALAGRGDPADVDTLLATPWPGAWKLALARIERLHARPPDPRIAAAIPRIRASYVSFASAALHRSAERLERAMTGVPHGRAPAELIAETAEAGTPTRDLDKLWADFYARPDDLALRGVLADALQAAGDPRGEYIALSLAIGAGRGDAAIRKRAAQLLAAHGEKWLGAIGGAMRDGRVYTNGFLSALEIRTSSERLAACADDPAWRTVEALHVRSDPDALGSRSVALSRVLANAPSLRTLSLDWAQARALPEITGRFPNLRALGGDSWRHVEARTLAAFPALAVVGMNGRTYGAALDLALAVARGLPAPVLLLFNGQLLSDVLAAYAREPSVPELRVVGGRECQLAPTGWAVRVRRGEPRALLSWCGGRYVAGTLTEHVRVLRAAGKTEIEAWIPATAQAEGAAVGVTLAPHPLSPWAP